MRWRSYATSANGAGAPSTCCARARSSTARSSTPPPTRWCCATRTTASSTSTRRSSRPPAAARGRGRRATAALIPPASGAPGPSFTGAPSPASRSSSRRRRAPRRRALDVEVRGVPMTHQGRPHVLYIGRDITERKAPGGAARQRGAVPRDLQRLGRRAGAARRRFPHRRRQSGLRGDERLRARRGAGRRTG